MFEQPDLPLSLIDNAEIYNTFVHNSDEHEKIIKYLSDLYESHTQNEFLSIEEQLKELAQLPDFFLIYLIVEIQLMKKEKGCFKFENREKGCISAFFRSFVKAFEMAIENPNDMTISNELFKTIQSIATDTKNVEMKLINDKTSGEYRNVENEYLILSTNQVSDAGVAQLIKMIRHGPITTMIIGGEDDYKKMNDLLNKKNLCDQLMKILNQIGAIDNSNIDSTYDSINKIINKNIFDENIIRGFRYFKIKAHLIDKLNIQKSKPDSTINKIMEKLKNVEENNLDKFLTILQEIASTPSVSHLLNEVADELQINAEKYAQEAKEYKGHLIYHEHEKMKDLAYSDEDLAEELLIRVDSKNQDFYIQFAALEELKPLMDKYIKQYNEKVQSMLDKSADEKLYFLYEHIQIFLLIHPFIDANNRLFANVIAPRCHAQLKLKDFPLYFNPLVFYGHSLPEVVSTVKLACANMMAVKEHIHMGNNVFFNFLEKYLKPEELKQVHEFVAPFREFIDKLIAKENINLIEEYMKKNHSSNVSTQLFSPLSSEQLIIQDDIKALKKCKSIHEIMDFLQSRMKTLNNENNANIASLYAKLISELNTKNISHQPTRTP